MCVCRQLLLLFYLVLAIESVDVQSQPSHPNLYFSADEVQSMRIKADSTHWHIVSEIKDLVNLLKAKPALYLPPLNWNKFAGSWNEHYGNHLGALAMYCVLKPDDKKALNLTITYMDRMARLPNWRVEASPEDDVPVAHSLVGFATAFDFLFEYLSERRQAEYVMKLKRVTARMFVRSKVAWWGKEYIQNHVATNLVALFTASLVVMPHELQAVKWRDHAFLLMERTVRLLNLVIDGSLEEGVSYGSYTSRSLTQFVYLAQRHMKQDHTRDFFLKQHFRFYLATVLPGFQEVVGIADSSRTWFYGPESQLVFLDAFVMKNGYGNWLASRIREHRHMPDALQPAMAHRWCTLHTEFIWYKASLSPKSPFEVKMDNFDNLKFTNMDFQSKVLSTRSSSYSKLIKFSDWGIVTYGGGQEKWHTYVSFKSGALHGRAIHSIIKKKMYRWISGWSSFNPGHEHPDQNSFVFFPNGQPFITEALYGPKYTFLNNVLTFGPVDSAQCYMPHQGQNGECQKWIVYNEDGIEQTWGEVVTATEQADMLFTSGEAAGAYPSKLSLGSVYRALLLLDKETLLVLDHILLRDESTLKVSNAYFHNIHVPFQLLTSSTGVSPQAFIEHDGKKRNVFWISSNQNELKATTNSLTYSAEFGTRKTNMLNVSVSLTRPITRVAYLFAAEGSHITLFSFLSQSDIGIRIAVGIGKKIYNISIVTDHKDAKSRHSWLGFMGYAHVNVSTGLCVRFGLDTVSIRNGDQQVVQYGRPKPPPGAGILFEEGNEFEQPFMAVEDELLKGMDGNEEIKEQNEEEIEEQYEEQNNEQDEKQNEERNEKKDVKFTGDVAQALDDDVSSRNSYEWILVLALLLFIVCVQMRKRTVAKYLLLLAIASLLSSFSLLLIFAEHEAAGPHGHQVDLKGKTVHDTLQVSDDQKETLDDLQEIQPDMDIFRLSDLRKKKKVKRVPQKVKYSIIKTEMTPVLRPKVFITSLLSCGSTLVSGLFGNRTDFFVMSFPTSAIQPSGQEVQVDPFVDACDWSSASQNFPLIGGWFQSMYDDPLKHLSPGTNAILSTSSKQHLVYLKDHRLSYPNAQVVLHSLSASWNLKLQWLHNVVGPSLKIIYVVRDPRSWIDSLLHKDDNRFIRWNVEQRLRDMLNQLPSVCGNGSTYAAEYNIIRKYINSETTKISPHKLLAKLWRANTEAALRLNKVLPQRNYLQVRFEDLIRSPVQTAEQIFHFLDMPLPLSVEHWILQSTRTGLFRHGSDKQLSLATLDLWKKSLTVNQVRDIEAVCMPVMTQLSYKTYSVE